MEREKCPDCGTELSFIENRRMDEQMEIIPICKKCKQAFRHPNLGWQILKGVNDGYFLLP